MRWPGKFEAGKVLNGIVTHQEWLPTLLAAAGEPDVKEKLLEGHQAGDKDFHVHIDGYNILPYLTGETDESPRKLLLLHQRRRRDYGPPRQRLEAGLLGAAGQDDAALGGTVRRTARAQDL